MQLAYGADKTPSSVNKKVLTGLGLFFVGVAGMAIALYELRESNPLPPSSWTVPLLLLSALITVVSILFTSAQHFKKGGI